jgi:hypothetical protein
MEQSEPEIENLLRFYKKYKKAINLILIAICIIAIIYGVFHLSAIYQCVAIGGFYMEDKTCYIPINEQEREEIIKNGYRKTYQFMENPFKVYNLSVQ